jgi:hypothetical protein
MIVCLLLARLRIEVVVELQDSRAGLGTPPFNLFLGPSGRGLSGAEKEVEYRVLCTHGACRVALLTPSRAARLFVVERAECRSCIESNKQKLIHQNNTSGINKKRRNKSHQSVVE